MLSTTLGHATASANGGSVRLRLSTYIADTRSPIAQTKMKPVEIIDASVNTCQALSMVSTVPAQYPGLCGDAPPGFWRRAGRVLCFALRTERAPTRARSSADRAFGCGPRGRGFKSLRAYHSDLDADSGCWGCDVHFSHRNLVTNVMRLWGTWQFASSTQHGEHMRT